MTDVWARSVPLMSFKYGELRIYGNISLQQSISIVKICGKYDFYGLLFLNFIRKSFVIRASSMDRLRAATLGGMIEPRTAPHGQSAAPAELGRAELAMRCPARRKIGVVRCTRGTASQRLSPTSYL